MGADQILAIVQHGGTLGAITLLFFLWNRERSERIAAQALNLAMAKENAEAAARMARATDDNTRATSTLAERMQQFGEKIENLVRRRA